MNLKKKLEYEGTVRSTTHYGDLEIVEYNGSKNVTVKFVDTGTVKRSTITEINKGEVKDPYRPMFEGGACIGEGPFKITRVKTDVYKCYQRWRSMLCRCYDPENKYYLRYGGRGVQVCEEWLVFQNYASWYFKNYKEGCYVDKDLTVPNSKLYCPETCSFVPEHINNLLLCANSIRGNLPVGVSFIKGKNRYRARTYQWGKEVNLGWFQTSEEAFAVYKKEKEKHIKEIAEHYFKTGDITKGVRQNLMQHEIVPFPE